MNKSKKGHFRKEEVLKNSRRIPVVEILKDAQKFNLSLYAKLLIESNWNEGENHRYLYKNMYVMSDYIKDLRISRNTLKKDIAYLKECHAIKLGEYEELGSMNGGRNEVIKIYTVREQFIAFEVDYIRYLITNLSDFEFKLYTLYYQYSKCSLGYCTLDQGTLLNKLNYSDCSGNRMKITEANRKLERLGLVIVTKSQKVDGKRDGFKTRLRIKAPIYYELAAYKTMKETGDFKGILMLENEIVREVIWEDNEPKWETGFNYNQISA